MQPLANGDSRFSPICRTGAILLTRFSTMINQSSFSSIHGVQVHRPTLWHQPKCPSRIERFSLYSKREIQTSTIIRYLYFDKRRSYSIALTRNAFHRALTLRFRWFGLFAGCKRARWVCPGGYWSHLFRPKGSYIGARLGIRPAWKEDLGNCMFRIAWISKSGCAKNGRTDSRIPGHFQYSQWACRYMPCYRY